MKSMRRLGTARRPKKKSSLFFGTRARLMKKKTKVNSVAWLSNVIFLLQRGDLSVDDVFEMTNTPRNEACESLLFEHPSIRVRDERASFQRFAEINHKEDLLVFFRARRPAGVRRIDLRGLYPFVDADLDELIFRGELVHLDHRQDALTLPLDGTPLPNWIKSMVLEAIESR